MPVLAAAALPLAIGVLMAQGDLAGDHDALVHLAMMAVLHGAAGWVSWACRASGWADCILWALGLVLHTVTYPLNWAYYTGIVGYNGVAEDLSVVAVVLLPSVLMYAGPFRAVLRPPEEARQSDSEGDS